MREYLPYILLVVAVVGAYAYRKGGLKLPSTIGPATPPPPLNATASELFAAAQSLARQEANTLLDRKLAEEAVKAAIAVYHAPFSAPPAEGDKPAA